MIIEVVSAVETSLPQCQRVGLLATTGTVSTELYQKAFERVEIRVLFPDPTDQTEIMDAILAIKAGGEKEESRKRLLESGNLLIDAQADALILGCTEVSLVLDAGDFSVPVFDSNHILAEATVKFARQHSQ